MDQTGEQSKLGEKLMGPLSKIVSEHGAQLLPMLKGGSSGLTQAALKNDETVRTVARYCYAALPGLVRLAVREAAFISFVLTNREKILGKIVDKKANLA